MKNDRFPTAGEMAEAKEKARSHEAGREEAEAYREILKKVSAKILGLVPECLRV